MGVQSLSGKDPLEKGMAIHSNILVWKIPWTEKPGRLQSIVAQRVRHDSACMHARTHFISVQSFSRVQLFATPWTAAC